MTERESLICLNAVSGLGSLRVKSLLDFLGSASAVWQARETTLRAVPGIGREIAGRIRGFDRDAFLLGEDALLKAHGAGVVTFFDDGYPLELKNIADPPRVVYYRGQWDCGMFPGLAVVGSRRASVYGVSVARAFAAECAGLGITVISGMARGIDTAAHAGCLDAGGKTVAVLGSGLACVYPRENMALFHAISRSGCVISEFPMSVGPVAGNFPRRNRVISGLSHGVIVVEAAARSGALITSRCALEQGRDVFAVPGKIGQAQAIGTNRLIQQGAKLIFSVMEAVEEVPAFQARIKSRPVSALARAQVLTDAERRVFSAVSDEPVYLDGIIEKSGVDVQQALTVLLQLECRGLVKRLAGNYFVTTAVIG